MWYDFLFEVVGSDLFCTVIGGVLVFVASQLLLELLIKPIIEYRKTISKIKYTLEYYADVISNPIIISNDNQKEGFEIFVKSKHFLASEELRKLGCEITTFAFKKKRNRKISEGLIYLSNSMWHYKGSVPIKEERNSIQLQKLRNLVYKKNNML